MTVKEIAAEAAVAETTIYRRWGSLTRLVAEALSVYAVTENPIPDTGSLEEDLTRLLRNVSAIIERPAVRRIFRFMTSLEEDGEELAQTRTRFWETRFAAGTSIVTRAIERGEIPSGTDPDAVIEVLVGAVYVRSFLLERPLTEKILTDSVEAAMLTARRSAATRQPDPAS